MKQPYSQMRYTVAIRSRATERVAELTALATACNCIVRSEGDALPEADFLLVDIRSETVAIDRDLSEITDYLDRYGAEALVWMDPIEFEPVYAALPFGRVYFIFGSDREAVPVLRGAFKSSASIVREGEEGAHYMMLHRISGELADFSAMLARIAAEAKDSAVHDRESSFSAAPSGTFLPLVQTTAAPAAELNAQVVREMIRLRRMRDRFFDSALFADPAWDILLDLLAAQLEGKKVSVSSLCIAASVPPTTALRWIGAMTESGLLTRTHDPVDARRIFIGLAPETERRMRSYFADVGNLPTPI